MINGLVLYGISLSFLAYSAVKDRQKTKKALKKSWQMFVTILPDMLAILLMIGLVLALLTPQMIANIMGENSGLWGILSAIMIGSIAIVPSFIVFPLGKTLFENGADLPQVAVLMSSLMAVGLTILPLEQKIFGLKFTLYRTVAAIIMCLLFGLLIKVVI